MEQKKLMDALSDVSVMVKKKLERVGGFCAFVITYSMGGNYLAEIEPGTTVLETKIAFARTVIWLKIQSPYLFVLGINKSRGALIIAKTSDTTYHLNIDYTVQDGQYVFTENITNEICSKYNNYFHEVYRKSNN